MKRLLCGVLALMLLMLGTCTPALAEKLVDSGDVGTIHWELDSKGKLTVTGTGIIEKIPAVDAYTKKIKSVEIGDQITEISSKAFQSLVALEKIIIGEQVTWIDNGAFWNCPKVQYVTFTGGKVTGDYVFFGKVGTSSMKGITAPNTASIIVENETVYSKDKKMIYFYWGSTPSVYYIPNGTESLGSGVYQGKKMQAVFFPASLKTFGSSVFNHCTQLKDVFFEDISSPISTQSQCGIF